MKNILEQKCPHCGSIKTKQNYCDKECLFVSRSCKQCDTEYHVFYHDNTFIDVAYVETVGNLYSKDLAVKDSSEKNPTDFKSISI